MHLAMTLEWLLCSEWHSHPQLSALDSWRIWTCLWLFIIKILSYFQSNIYFQNSYLPPCSWFIHPGPLIYCCTLSRHQVCPTVSCKAKLDPSFHWHFLILSVMSYLCFFLFCVDVVFGICCYFLSVLLLLSSRPAAPRANVMVEWGAHNKYIYIYCF